MNVFRVIFGMGNIFPKKITMSDINKMKRRELTIKEKEKFYSKYYYKEMAEIPSSDLEKVNNGPADPSKVITIHERSKLMDPGYLDVETGYTVMPDGSGVAATMVQMPGVTPEMLDWWFNWHGLEGLRYAIWCPVAHTDIRVKDNKRHLDSSGIPMRERNYGATHYPVEGFNLEGAQKVRIEFFSPGNFGLDLSKFKEPNISIAVAANCLVDRQSLPINVFFHAIRRVNGGVEYRSRYWLGYSMKNGVPAIKKINRLMPKWMMMHMARNNCIHSLMEYNNLASFLPKLYKEMNGKIE
jgi:phloretin hydrolase